MKLTSNGRTMLLWATCAAGCTGVIDDGGMQVGGADTLGSAGVRPGKSPPPAGMPAGMIVPPGPGGTGTPSVASSACTGPAAGEAPLRRLTNQQYDNALRDLFAPVLVGTPSGLLSSGDARVGPFSSNAGVAISELGVQDYGAAADDVASKVAAALTQVLPCDPAAGEETCARAYLAKLGRRAYRRTVEADELNGLVALYRAGRAGKTFADGVRVALTAVLQSPHFLYHIELGKPDARGATTPLTAFEVASRLSFLFWNSIPDDPLLVAAERNGLDVAGVEQQARRLMASQRFRTAIEAFHVQWLELDMLEQVGDKDRKLYPLYNPALKRLMASELGQFASHVILSAGGKMETLFTSPTTFVRGGLASVYELPAAPAGAGDAWRQVELNPAQRAGFLTQVGFLARTSHADQTSPVIRGRIVRANVLCEPPPPPPPGVNDEPPGLDASLPTRQRFEKLAKGTDCFACHRLMNPIGYTFENYDALGQWRDTEGGMAVDASGEVVGSADAALAGRIVGAVDLGKRLGRSQTVARCMTTNWMRYALARELGAGDACSHERAFEGFRQSGMDVRELLVAVVKSDTFGNRAAIVSGSAAP